MDLPAAFALASGVELSAFGFAAIAELVEPPEEAGALTGLAYADGAVIVACQAATYSMAPNGVLTPFVFA